MKRVLLYRVQKTVTFEASHQLGGLPEGHPCGKMHGHSYRAEVTVSAQDLDVVGFVVDFGVVKEISARLDHQHLNTILKVNPTAENIAQYIWQKVMDFIFSEEAPALCEKVRVYETATGWAEVECCEVP